MVPELAGPIGGVSACEDTPSSDYFEDLEAVMELDNNSESFHDHKELRLGLKLLKACMAR
jgi:hypothetical protein